MAIAMGSPRFTRFENKPAFWGIYMKHLAFLVVAYAFQSLALVSSASAGTLIPIQPPSGSFQTGIFDINNRGQIAGSFTTDGVDLIGFFGSIDGNYQTFTVNGNQTEARAINGQGLVIGFYVDEGLPVEFAREPDGSLSDITKDGIPLLGIAQGINAAGEFVGDYVRDSGSVPVRGGYKGNNSAWQEDVDLPFPAVRVAPRGINERGDIVGWFVAEGGEGTQGFLISDGATTVLNFPGAASTFVQGINNRGQLSGSWEDADRVSHGFFLDSDLASWTSIDAPNSMNTQAFQINDLGQVALNGYGDTSKESYIYCPDNLGVCNDTNPHLPANETTVTGQVLYEPAQGQPVQSSGSTTHRYHLR